MVDAGDKKQQPLTPAKLALIAVLAVVLVIVLAVQYGGSEPERIVVAPRPRSSQTSAANEGAAGTPAGGRDRERPAGTWPEIPLVEVRSYDPFQLPYLVESKRGPQQEPLAAEVEQTGEGLADRERAERKLVQSFQQQGVGMVVITPRGKMARVGDRYVREGDEVQGLRVVEIHNRGIVLRPAAPENPGKPEDPASHKKPENPEISANPEHEQRSQPQGPRDVFGWLRAGWKRITNTVGADHRVAP